MDHPIVRMEILYSARTSSGYVALEAELDARRIVRSDRAVADTAMRALSELSTIPIVQDARPSAAYGSNTSPSEGGLMAGELSFFELGVQDAERASVFYGKLFGWRLEPGPSGQGFSITTPDVPGGMHGGDPGATPYVFFRVEDMERALDLVRELGGVVEDTNVEGDDSSIARFGRFRLCRDDQGSPFGLHQPPGER